MIGAAIGAALLGAAAVSADKTTYTQNAICNKYVIGSDFMAQY